MFLPSENTQSQDIADVVIYGHIHHPYMDKIYNKTMINVGSVGNSFDIIRNKNKNKDSDMLETTKSNYLIIEGEYRSKEYSSDISFQFIKLPYDIYRELEDENLNIEKDNKILMVKEAKKKCYGKWISKEKLINMTDKELRDEKRIKITLQMLEENKVYPLDAIKILEYIN